MGVIILSAQALPYYCHAVINGGYWALEVELDLAKAKRYYGRL